MKILALLTISALLLTGCYSNVHVPDSRVNLPGGVSVDIGDDGYGYKNKRQPRHCPPGHAKKGWC